MAVASSKVGSNVAKVTTSNNSALSEPVIEIEA